MAWEEAEVVEAHLFQAQEAEAVEALDRLTEATSQLNHSERHFELKFE